MRKNEKRIERAVIGSCIAMGLGVVAEVLLYAGAGTSGAMVRIAMLILLAVSAGLLIAGALEL